MCTLMLGYEIAFIRGKTKVRNPLACEGSPNGSDGTGHLGDVQPPHCREWVGSFMKLRCNVKGPSAGRTGQSHRRGGDAQPTLGVNRADIGNSSGTNDVNSEDVVPLGDKTSSDGWHIIQFSGGKNTPTVFDLILFWKKNSTSSADKADGQSPDQRPLLKLRTDVDRLTPKTERVLAKLPAWCSLFGKSTSPHTLAVLTSLPVNF
ncbi:hypothetical protein CJ030_MR3G018671 [Morella rubra]|uniref:Uncharacterized protein n=1 Tax=Morella rubra TaxID=262757 RepID=A0A6A1W1H4_9ROSI|nr:hypothetical protein CJ030_MR3G018671 [Morella rubra]